ncbi:hypothetical protein GCM10011505_33850 [Tistrella bauzanensis]|uniref:Uncharacterized protein n=2 Tax=Tistrella bauzanensis TaxID=657419 RepID=A0ABQ1IQK5_9PROT|nr:hypothetical protein [Tistrella bauzanensis]GGB49975.1 hypothetical protein GCM10011505_33850 [Tistrella bauzanensis]
MMGTYRHHRMTAAVVAGLTLASALPALAVPAAAAGQTLTYSDYGTARGVQGIALTKFAEQLQDMTDGDLKLRITFGGALIALRDVLRGVGDGVADMAPSSRSARPSNCSTSGPPTSMVARCGPTRRIRWPSKPSVRSRSRLPSPMSISRSIAG